MTFREFYPIYLAAHRRRLNRAIHYVGAISVLASVVTAVAYGSVRIFLWSVAAIYLILWLSHFFIEHNRPLTLAGGWRMVVLSMCGEFYMTWRFLTGRIHADLQRYGIRDDGTHTPC